MINEVDKFWDKEWEKRQKDNKVPQLKKTLRHIKFLELITKNAPKSILEIGVGRGQLTLELIKKGFDVFSIDISDSACKISRITISNQLGEKYEKILCMDALNIEKLNKKFDCIIGIDILHHIEPLDLFLHAIDNSLNKNGKAIFAENSARNIFLMFGRNHLAGKRFGIPKYGDDFEHPITIEEIKLIRKKFNFTKVYFPEFYFFQKVHYLVSTESIIFNFAKKLDDKIGQHVKWANKYSWLQVIEFRN